MRISLGNANFHGSIKIGGVQFNGCVSFSPVVITAGEVTGRSEGRIHHADRTSYEQAQTKYTNTQIMACAGVDIWKIAHIGYKFSGDIGWDGSRSLSHEVSVSKIAHEKNPLKISISRETDANAYGQSVTRNILGVGVSM